MNHIGGENKPHGQIERTDRIDSFEAGESSGILMAARDGHWLRYDRYALYEDGEVVELSYPGGRWRTILELSLVPSGFGGSRAFWLCPCCGKRVRYLYSKGQGFFVCRDCAKLNYRSQQRTKSGISYVWDGLRLAREKLRWKPPGWFAPLDFPYITPPRLRCMHQTTYLRYLAQYRRYQERYQRASLWEMLAVLGR